MLHRLATALLFRLPPETAHALAVGALRAFVAVPGARRLLGAVCSVSDPALRTRALGLDLPSPIGLAAGFDKDAVAFEALGALGFGFVEVGTLTARAQPGNPTPRLFRLPADRALVNRMGFNNGGAAAAAARLAAPRRTVVGVNIGRTKLVSDDAALDDYAASARAIAPHADYVVVNVSSPNTPGLRDLQAVERLRPLLVRVRDELDRARTTSRVPLLVKIAPDLGDADVLAVAELALDLGLDGVVATNTTIARPALRTSRAEVDALGAGGLSGPPLRERALAVLRLLRGRVGERLVLVAAGGIEGPDDAWERVRAGATLVQIYTGFVYGGPLAPSRIARGLAARARAGGFSAVQAAVGVDASG
ncbi:MAG: quinone-dependent dihydroorotate dehydrogenase [Polyangiaceae bacterium]|nr:quinone-dependent dihydroorotate dehydrogenase [Polyangiaceae bacterium]